MPWCLEFTNNTLSEDITVLNGLRLIYIMPQQPKEGARCDKGPNCKCLEFKTSRSDLPGLAWRALAWRVLMRYTAL